MGCIELTHYLPCIYHSHPFSCKFLCKLPRDPSMKGAGLCCHCRGQDRFGHRLQWSRRHRHLRRLQISGSCSYNGPLLKRTEGNKHQKIDKNGFFAQHPWRNFGALWWFAGCTSCAKEMWETRSVLVESQVKSVQLQDSNMKCHGKKHLRHAFQIHFVHSGLTAINHGSTLDSQAAPHAVWRDTKSWYSAASLARSDALANAQKNSSNIPRDPAETCQTREPKLGRLHFQWMYLQYVIPHLGNRVWMQVAN